MTKVTRRQALTAAGVGAAVVTMTKATGRARAAALGAGAGDAPFTLPPLPYPANALAKAIDEQTMTIHHDRHHQAYVDNLNAALKGHAELAKQPIEQILRDIKKVPMAVRQAVINNGGGHHNHTLFWEIMSPKGGGEPMGALAKTITSTFESLAKFKNMLSQAATTRFGSGWGWLVASGGRLEVISTPNQDSPLMEGKTPLLGVDVWEHAYYLRYQNRRAAYLEAWWNVVNWPNVAERFDRARK